jgi:DNA-binding XRE family transcriptional regulator
MTQDINRLKVVLAEKKHTNKWLAERDGKGSPTVSKWNTNTLQPNLAILVTIAKAFNGDVYDLL